jgi:HEAT repeat protein
VTAEALLLFVALGQGASILALIAALLANRWWRRRRRDRVAPRRMVLDEAIKGWALGEVGPELVVRRLEALPRGDAVAALLAWSVRLTGERWRSLAEALERRPWTTRLRKAVRSRTWWRRLEAARLLSIAGTAADLSVIEQLLKDRHPAVRIAIALALGRIATPRLVNVVLDRLPDMVGPVQAHYAAVLRGQNAVTVPLLSERLGLVYDPGLPRIVEFAGRIGDARLREPITALATHRDAEVRVQVARALGDYPHARTVTVLRALATDPAWEVRALAVRSLGRIADAATLPDLRARLADVEWWVRLRAALALTRLGAPGQGALLHAEVGANPDARYVARLILGLSPQALAEFAA